MIYMKFYEMDKENNPKDGIVVFESENMPTVNNKNSKTDLKFTLKLYTVYLSCLMYIADLLSDWYLLLFTYLVNGDYIELQLTAIIMVCSAVIVGYKYNEHM